MSHPKSRNVGAGVLTRYRNGACTFTCRHDGCRAWWEPRTWRAGLRQARTHAADHAATFAATVASMASRAAQAPVPPIGIVTITAAPSSHAAPATTGYRPTPAGPPATDAQGQWIPNPDPATSSTGGSR